MKKILSIAMCVALILCTAITAFAAATNTNSGKITGMVGSLTLGYSGSTDLGEVNPQDSRVETIYLYDTMFSWDGYNSGAIDGENATPTQLTSSQIRTAKLGVKTNASSKVVEKVSISNRDGRIEVEFTDEFVSTKEQDFDFDVYLTIDGRRMSDYAISFTGTLANPVVEVYAGEDSVDIADGYVAEAQEYISSINVQIGHGVTVKTRLAKDKKVYGTVSMTPTAEDDKVMTEHKSIDEVLSLKTVGLNSSGNVVRLGSEYSGYHAYSKDLTYLGTSKDDLEYSEKYYLTKTKLDIADDDEVVKETGSSSISIADDVNEGNLYDTTPPNVNANPGTGR